MATKKWRRSCFMMLVGTGAILAACSTPTLYQPLTAVSRAAGGYSESKLADARYRVAFFGNNLASRNRVETYLLYRAAELTAGEGYDWFLIVDRHTEHDVETFVASNPPRTGNYPNWLPEWRYRRSGLDWASWPNSFDSLDVRTVESFEANAEIVMRRGPMPAAEERAFDARQVMAGLEGSIERPQAGRRPGSH